MSTFPLKADIPPYAIDVSALGQERTILEWLERWDRVTSANKVTLPL